MVAVRIRNKTLYALVSEFVKSTIELLHRLTAGEALPRREVTKYTFKQNGTVEMHEEPEIDFFLLLFKYSNEIDALQNFKDCARYVLSNSVTRKKLNLVSRGEQALEEVPLTLSNFMMLRSLLGTFLKRAGELSFIDEAFDRLYEEFEHYLYISKIPYKVTAPIIGLSGDIGEVAFDKHLKLCRMSASDRTAFMEEATSPMTASGFDSFGIQSAQYMLEADYSQRERVPMDTRAGVNKFEEVVSVLRLWKSGKVRLVGTKVNPSIWTPHHGRVFGHRFSWRGFVVPSSYVLNKTEESSLLHLWRRTRDFKEEEGGTKNGKYINIALRRFDLGVEEDNIENKMIDFLIAFEALYLNEMDELTYRLSLRTAVLLGRSDDETTTIREIIAKGYKLRSEIVHGKELSQIRIRGKVIALDDFVRQVENYLRKSLRSFLVLSKNYKGQEKTLGFLEKSLTDAKTRKILRKMMRTTV
jgi:hypothetical protein